MNENVQMKKKYDALGSEFEKIVFSNISEVQKIKNYELIAEKIDQLRINDTPVSQNYLTDLIHIICRNTCLIEKNLWLNLLYKNSHNNETVNLDNIDCNVNEFRSYNEDNEC